MDRCAEKQNLIDLLEGCRRRQQPSMQHVKTAEENPSTGSSKDHSSSHVPGMLVSMEACQDDLVGCTGSPAPERMMSLFQYDFACVGPQGHDSVPTASTSATVTPTSSTHLARKGHSRHRRSAPRVLIGCGPGAGLMRGCLYICNINISLSSQALLANSAPMAFRKQP